MVESNKKFFIIIFIILIIILTLFIPLILLLNKTKSTSENEKEEGVVVYPPKQKIINSIEILRFPNKITYKEGDFFDKSGMIIKILYNDNTESFTNNFEINPFLPLTIYDSTIIISYKDKKTALNIIITNEEGIIIYPNFSNEKYTVEIKEGITRFELEDSDFSNWIISKENDINKIIKRNDSSRGSFLSGIDKNILYEGIITFKLYLQYNSEIEISVSLSQNEQYKHYNMNISTIYNLTINENKILEINGDDILNSREDITKWQIIKYKTFFLEEGNHTISIKAFPNLEIGSPNIDFIDFKTKKIKEITIVPKNDFHTLIQYKYILDIPGNINKYTNGIEDLSRPKGNILDFSDSVNESSTAYIIELSTSKNFNKTDTKIIKGLKEKYYIIKNLKLGQKIFYRGAINEDKLKNSKIYELNINTLAPRNLDIPGVVNCRDIGGVKTILVENGIIKQGLFYRSAQIDNIEEEGKKILTEDLGIKIEIDIREEQNNTSPNIEGIKHIPIPIMSVEYRWFDSYNEQYIQIFNIIAEADINPVLLHCVYGADRTGILTFALMSLLGCEYDDIARNYLFTNFAGQVSKNIDYPNSPFNIWWNKLDYYDGETKAEKCKYWLMGKGIEESKLEHIRSIFIDNYQEKSVLDEYEFKESRQKFLGFFNE